MCHLHNIIARQVVLEVKASSNRAIDAPKATQEMQIDKLAVVGEPTSDTFTTVDHEQIHSFYCSTPKKPRNICDGCKKWIFDRFIEDGT